MRWAKACRRRRNRRIKRPRRAPRRRGANTEQPRTMMSDRPRVGLFVTCLVDLVRPACGLCGGKAAGGRGLHGRSARERRPAADSRPGMRVPTRHAADIAPPGDRCIRAVRLCRRAVGLLRRHDPAPLSRSLERRSGLCARARARSAAKTHELVSFLVRVRGVARVAAKLHGAGRLSRFLLAPARDGRQGRAAPACSPSVEGLRCRIAAMPQVCCGFGGLFSVKYPEISERMADDKIADARKTGADAAGRRRSRLPAASGRPLERAGQGLRVLHVAEVLAGMGDEPALGRARR